MAVCWPRWWGGGGGGGEVVREGVSGCGNTQAARYGGQGCKDAIFRRGASHARATAKLNLELATRSTTTCISTTRYVTIPHDDDDCAVASLLNGISTAKCLLLLACQNTAPSRQWRSSAGLILASEVVFQSVESSKSGPCCDTRPSFIDFHQLLLLLPSLFRLSRSRTRYWLARGRGETTSRLAIRQATSNVALSLPSAAVVSSLSHRWPCDEPDETNARSVLRFLAITKSICAPPARASPAAEPPPFPTQRSTQGVCSCDSRSISPA